MGESASTVVSWGIDLPTALRSESLEKVEGVVVEELASDVEKTVIL